MPVFRGINTGLFLLFLWYSSNYSMNLQVECDKSLKEPIYDEAITS